MYVIKEFFGDMRGQVLGNAETLSDGIAFLNGITKQRGLKEWCRENDRKNDAIDFLYMKEGSIAQFLIEPVNNRM